MHSSIDSSQVNDQLPSLSFCDWTSAAPHAVSEVRIAMLRQRIEVTMPDLRASCTLERKRDAGVDHVQFLAFVVVPGVRAVDEIDIEVHVLAQVVDDARRDTGLRL